MAGQSPNEKLQQQYHQQEKGDPLWRQERIMQLPEADYEDHLKVEDFRPGPARKFPL